MAEKYLYFRSVSTDTDDDATGDSACFPASSLMGMQPTSDTALTLYFKNMLIGSGNHGYDPGEDAAKFENYDSVILTIPDTGTSHVVAMKAIVNAISGSNFPSFIVVANNRSGNTEYLAGSGITACGTITVASIYAWAADCNCG